uniref:BTB domain-containing protein n=1 Tax=Arcella intermedia TaxID=1963864 RepID=A0A6B2LII9_9EUKA|eukprot:TRINITY_DN20065_c0_g1_i1.p1 TRINITY_DN20065_c0_g1~~TRINITY_DN20065_c0_g1_i1.p1  ORF type:complete len:219 (+),score=46.80 TRINITY_DN20065_c0_g1_i1:239-895(+)
MSNVNQTATKPSELVKFNVGGKRFLTSYSTVTAKGENFLSRLVDYHKRGDMSVGTDEKGYLFIDRNGEVFQVILDYLRTNELFVNGNVTVRQVLCDLDYYQIKRECSAISLVLKKWQEEAEIFFKKHGAGITNHLVKQIEQGNITPTLRVVEYIRYKQPYPFSWDIDSNFTAEECINFGKAAFQKELSRIFLTQGLSVEFSIQSDSYSRCHICTFTTI